MNETARKLALASGISPLDFMLHVLRDNDQPQEMRMDAAKAAAPYVHARLAAVEHSGSVEVKRRVDLTDEQLADIAAGGSAGAAETTEGSRKLN